MCFFHPSSCPAAETRKAAPGVGVGEGRAWERHLCDWSRRGKEWVLFLLFTMITTQQGDTLIWTVLWVNLIDYILIFGQTIVSCDFIYLITTLQHQLISHNISFVLRVLFWTRHLQSPNKHVISHLIPAQRSVDRIADQTWWLIYRGYQTEWGAEFGKRSPSSQCSFLKWSLTALSHGLPPTPTGWTLSNHL